MKYFIFFLLLLFGLPVKSQSLKSQFGVSFSSELSFLLENSEAGFDNNLGSRISQPGFDLNVGFQWRYFFNDRLSSTFGLSFQTRHYHISERYRFSFNPESSIIDPGISSFFFAPKEDQIILNSLEVPLNVEYWLKDGWRVFSGIRLKKTTKKERKQVFDNSQDDTTDTIITAANVKEVPVGLNFGLGKQFLFQKTALQISYQNKIDLNKIKNTSLDVSKLQFSTGLTITFWFSQLKKT